MTKTFSIATLFVLTTLAAVSVFVWQVTHPLDHFKLDVSGAVVTKLPPDTELHIIANPDHKPGWEPEVELNLKDLPAVLPVNYSRRGCVVEFWTGTLDSEERMLFSVVVDRQLFDRFRVITLRLDKPTTELNAVVDFWATQRWSPNSTRRMRYFELPWWNQAKGRLEPIPKMPELTVTDARTGAVLERNSLEHHECDFTGYYAEIAYKTPLKLRDGDKLAFTVVYDSGGLFTTISTVEQFNYSEGRHRF